MFIALVRLVDNDGDAEKVLFSYGYGASLPTSAKRRLQHSVHLAKRVIQLEQANTSLRLELDRERKKSVDTKHDVLTIDRSPVSSRCLLSS